VARVPIVRVADTLIAAVQDDLSDQDALRFQEDLMSAIEHGDIRGVLIDLTTVEIVDSFLGRLLGNLAVGVRLLGAEVVVVGIQPAVAITLVELGLDLRGVALALTPDKGLRLLQRRLAERDRHDR
jgi:rsbT antagonist protein RsbS